jgi:hypothetical protein
MSHLIGPGKLENQFDIDCLTFATLISIISITHINITVVGAIVMQIIYTQDLTASMESHATQALNLLLDFDHILPTVSIKAESNRSVCPAGLALNTISSAVRLHQI